MKSEVIEKQTKMYLYDLSNTAREHGFKADDKWELSLVTDAERSKIQKDYHPAIATKIYPEMLLQVFTTVKEKLNQELNSDEESLDLKSVLNRELNFIVAYNPKRQRS